MVWSFWPEWLRVDTPISDKITEHHYGPRQLTEIYADSWPYELARSSGGMQTVRPFANHSVDPALVRYGAWMLSDDFDRLLAFAAPTMDAYWAEP